MLEIERKRKNVFPFRDLAPGQLFKKFGRSGSVYYSFYNQNGEFTAVDLINHEEIDSISLDDEIEVIDGKLTIFG